MDDNLVRDWMTPEPITINNSASLPEAYWLMIENKIRRLPVLHDGRLVGIVTLEDIRQKTPATVTGIDAVRTNDTLANLPVRQVMTERPKTISVDSPLVDAARQMLEYKISALPVMDGDKLVGIITESDIFRAVVKRLKA